MTWILNRLAVAGDADAFHEFVTAAQGPGFIDWWPSFERATEHLPEPVAISLRRRLRAIHNTAQKAAVRDPRRCKLDFNALVPVPDDVRRRGYLPHGKQWCREHWGVDHQPNRLEFEVTEQKVRIAKMKRGRGRLTVLARPQIVFEFYTRDRSPWPLATHIATKWPALDVRLRTLELEDIASRSLARAA